MGRIVASILVMTALSFADYIDFSDDAFQTVQGKNSESFTDIDGSGLDIDLSVTPSEGEMTWYSDDGIGINYDYETDEIEDSEILKVTFSESVLLEEFDLTDFFIETRNGHEYAEVGWYELSSGGPVEITATTPGGNGEKNIAVNEVTSWVQFTAKGKTSNPYEDHEYAVKGLEYSSAAVPEPATLSLFLIGSLFLAAGAGLKRKK